MKSSDQVFVAGVTSSKAAAVMLMVVVLMAVVSPFVFADELMVRREPVSAGEDSAVVAKCKADLAERLEMKTEDIDVVDVQAAVWPDAALGMPEVGKAYAQVVTPGSRVMLEAKSTRYLYTTGKEAIKYGGPTSLWSFSMLYIKPVIGEPNLNGDLYQCSLLGTNSVRILSGVSAYYPQAQGAIIAKRRTSRSSHELLYVRACDAVNSIKLQSAFDFGAAALNDAQSEWAGFVKPGLGRDWQVVIAPLSANSSIEETLALPEGTRPGRVAWSGVDLMIEVNKGQGKLYYAKDPLEDEWKTILSYEFPGQRDFVLNKSETLEITQENGDVEVASVWFTGDRNVIARVSDLTLRDTALLGRFAFISGQKDSQTATYTVDMVTGEVIPGLSIPYGEIKPFMYPALSNPVLLELPKYDAVIE